MAKTRTMGPTGILRRLPAKTKSATQLTIEQPKPVSKQRDGMMTSRQGYVAAPTARATDRVGVPRIASAPQAPITARASAQVRAAAAAASPKLDMSKAALQSGGPIQLPTIVVTGSGVTDAEGRPLDDGLVDPYAEPGIESETVTAKTTPDGKVTAAPTVSPDLPEGERTYYGPWSEPVTQAPIAKSGASWPLLVGSGLALWFLLK